MAMNEAVIRDRTAEIAELVRSYLSPKAAQERLAEYHAGDIAAAAELLSAGERTKLFRTLDMDELAFSSISSRRIPQSTSRKRISGKLFC